ncbi:MAG: NAD(P)/FAD-dependent oxidoreductase [Bacteroidota bacterium]
MQKHLVVVGGGAAGFFCAINAANNNKDIKVTILEKSSKVLSKVKVSGGGRCNVTNVQQDIVELSKCYPRGEKFLKKAFHWFNTKDTLEWFAERGIKIVAESDGRMFPSTNTSQTIIDCFVSEVNRLGIEIRYFTNVTKIQQEELNGCTLFQVGNEEYSIKADYLCIATGGFIKEKPEWVKSLQLKVIDPLPSLFTFNIPNHPITTLMGVSMNNVAVKITGSNFVQKGDILITHWGLSGPAVLKLSAYAAILLAEKKYEFDVMVNWIGISNVQEINDILEDQRFSDGKKKVILSKVFDMPNRLWTFLVQQSKIGEDTNWADLKSEHKNKLIQNLHAYTLKVSGKTTFKDEFVTCGGVELSEIDVNTMQSKNIPGLFFCGEALNIDGITGGYNFQNAWTTSWIAAKEIGKLQES